MARPKAKREIAIKNIRIYPSTLDMLQDMAFSQRKTIALITHEAAYKLSKATRLPEIKY